MSGCCAHHPPERGNRRWRTALWIALAVNVVMFAVEVGAGLDAGSAALLADAADFAGDAGNYALSLLVLSMASVWASRAAMAKGLLMAAYGALVMGAALWHACQGIPPGAGVMGTVALMALLANAGVALLLYRFRNGDANMRSVWLCTRNDMVGNLAVMLAALGVFGTGSVWPDTAVAALMSALAWTSGVAVVRHARAEMQAAAG